MAKKSKLKTPDWILEGYDSPAEYNKAKGIKPSPDRDDPKVRSSGSKKKSEGSKTFKIRECPKCGSDDVGIVLSNLDSEDETSTGKEWECNKCNWKGSDIVERELTEDELMKYLDSKGEGVA